MAKVLLKIRKMDECWKKHIDVLEQSTDLEIVVAKNIDKHREDVEILITTNLQESELKQLPNLNKIYLYKTGMDKLPMNIIKKRGITVIPSYANAKIIAEHAISLALALLHRVVEFHNDLTEGIWFSDGNNYFWKSLYGMNVGIVGFGHIGKEICNFLLAFNVQCYCYNRSKKYSSDVIGIDYLQELVNKSDIIFIALPLTQETRGLFDANILKNMNSKYIVNVGRAEIIDEKALYNSLKNQTLAGYASDVWYNSPNKVNRTEEKNASNYPIEKFKNVVLSPHSATHEISAHERYIVDCINNVKKEIIK